MSAVYTKQANRARLAAQAIEKLKSIPAPDFQVRITSDKVVSNQPPKEKMVGEAEVQYTNEINNKDGR
jgi:hypothetical protein